MKHKLLEKLAEFAVMAIFGMLLIGAFNLLVWFCDVVLGFA